MQPFEQIIHSIRPVQARHRRAVVVAIDGGSAAGKSTIADTVAQRTAAAVVRLDDFYTTSVSEHDMARRSVEQRLRDVFEWERVRREALEPLRAGRRARWRAFDFAAGLRADGTYGLQGDFTEVAPAPVILLEGAYAASPPLADLVDLAVLVDVPVPERHRRAAAREDPAFLARWHAVWDDVETLYFEHVRPRGSFDLVVSNDWNAGQRSSG